MAHGSGEHLNSHTDKMMGTDLTSRGVPARLRILTATCTPATSSNARSAADESTRMQSSVSSTDDESGAADPLACFSRTVLPAPASSLGR